ncbi:hypothetical protein NM208_g15919 [Fusarium decemcellulare]|uniref:Uncharacterized protein n=1 Tax=Fusarium decemcellulare TaxID=57161 RepID=A0ACC1RE98_9HYPO|nr:hypothetical protein NM208_g15919 [Fusarium decemcellulare]
MSKPEIHTIPPAKFISSTSHVVPGQLSVTEFFFKVPLDYTDLDGPSITLFARRVRKHEVPIFPPQDDEEDGNEKDETGATAKPTIL